MAVVKLEMCSIALRFNSKQSDQEHSSAPDFVLKDPLVELVPPGPLRLSPFSFHNLNLVYTWLFIKGLFSFPADNDSITFQFKMYITGIFNQFQKS